MWFVIFKQKNLLLVILLSFSLFTALSSYAKPKAAIFTVNRADDSWDEQVNALSDSIASRLSNRGYEVISPEIAMESIRASASEAETALDQILRDQTSRTRLAQNLGADYLLFVSILNYSKNSREVDAYGIKNNNTDYILRSSYQLIDAVSGAALAGDTVKASFTLQQNQTVKNTSSDVSPRLIDEVAQLVAAGAAGKEIRESTEPTPPVDYYISVGLQDIVSGLVQVPDVTVDKKGNVQISEERYPVEVLDASVEIDGLVIGSAPGVFKIAPGIHKLRISREGFRDIVQTVNVSEGGRLRLAMQMTDEGLARWQDQMQFFENIRKSKEISAAQVKVMEGFAQTLQQSGFKVDVKSKSLGSIFKP